MPNLRKEVERARLQIPLHSVVRAGCSRDGQDWLLVGIWVPRTQVDTERRVVEFAIPDDAPAFSTPADSPQSTSQPLEPITTGDSAATSAPIDHIESDVGRPMTMEISGFDASSSEDEASGAERDPIEVGQARVQTMTRSVASQPKLMRPATRQWVTTT